MKYSKQQIVKRLSDPGLVPLFSHHDTQEMLTILEASYRAGLRVFEFTNRQENSFQMFQELVRFCSGLPDFILGVGTIMDGPTTQKFIDAGASFIISPIVKTEMGAVCEKNNVSWIPGAATLTEIVTAVDHGAAMVKIFPGSILGPAFISAIRPVIPHVPLMITGGVETTEQNLRSWFNAGATCVGLGSHLFPKELLLKKDWDGLENKIRMALDLVKSVRVTVK
jgi:2-dehydro-3-deoxyphosphogluconate aldolase / (4S)-4-hydroxy-2-oxoglutarate aldolase